MTDEKVKTDFDYFGYDNAGFTFEYVALQNDIYKEGFTFHPICKTSVDTLEMTEEEFLRWIKYIKKSAVVTLLNEFGKIPDKFRHVLSSGIIRDPSFPNDVSAYCFTLKFTEKKG